MEAVGAYAPRFRLTAAAAAEAWGEFRAPGISETAVPGADEDALTMGYEAATRALEAGDLAGADVDWLAFAASTPPVAEGDLTSRLAGFLGIASDVPGTTLTGSTRAGTQAIAAAAEAVAAGAGRALVVAADAPRGDPDDAIDHAAGAGAGAIVVSREGPARIVDRAAYASAHPGTRFRGAGEAATEGLGITQYDRRAFLEHVDGAVDGLAVEPDPDAVAIQAPDGKLPYRAADACGVDADAIRTCATVHDLGDLGAASVPVGLARALADGHESILAVGYGDGADALAIETETPTPAAMALDGDADPSYAESLRQRGRLTSGAPEGGGAYVSVPTWRRSLPQRHRLEAGRCGACDALAFPPSGACSACGELSGYEPVTLPGTGTVESVTTISQGGAPPEFAEYQAQAGDYAALIVALDAPGETDETVSIPAMGTGADADAFAVGDRVEATIRRLYTQEGLTRYATKMRPASDA
ncbi:zinc ribbon domain-containing protein [Halovivax limisalsi]|uniref:zinc ribbon domain-containing protein n=1 Tax=Halovivax limisalsi TaxID=1453760 RepID=UPI001FFCFF2B|nr:zinc ribbon domain-containing protein [Halovivax limisalsi]